MTFNYTRYGSYVGSTVAESNKAGIIDVINSQLIGDGLFAFTSFTFTNAGITGRLGPTSANCLSSYDTGSNPWLNNTAYFDVVTQGYQKWTVPKSGTYKITAIGAASGTGTTGRGAGATIIGEFSLTKGDILEIIVGQMGTDGANGCGGNVGGGGGGTFVRNTTTSEWLIAAGGGGGGSVVNTSSNQTASTTTTAKNGSAAGGTGGTGGNGGGIGTGCVPVSGGGAGVSTAGTNAASGGNGGDTYSGGFTGGTSSFTAPGGFGGGGAGAQYSGGGGGGYSGGGGGGLDVCSCSNLGAGGGGGSYNNGANTSSSTTNNTTHGSCLIEFI
jgi:hypothetical protein